MKKMILFLLILFVTHMTYAEYIFVGNVESVKEYPLRIEFKLTNALFNIYVVDENIVRFRYTNKNEFSKAPSYAVVYNVKKNIKYTFDDKGDYYNLKTSMLDVKINKEPCRISIYDNNGNLLNADEKSFGVSFDCDEVRCFKKLFDDESFYGLGEKSNSLQKSGEQYTMWNRDFPSYTERTDPLYQAIPFFIGIRKHKAYGIFFDNSYKSYFNMGASSNRFYWFGADKGEMNYYFIYGPSVKKVISSYTTLTGKMPMPPKWALGYQQSKWSYYPESKVKRIAETFRDRKIPCDVIYLDIDYMNGYRVFTWNKKRFPEPAEMLSELKSVGFKVVPIIDPGVKADSNYFAAKEGLQKDLFAKYPDGVVYQGEVWPSWAYFPDFTKKETRDWWGKNISSFLNLGVEGIWNDMNEPSVWGQAFPDIVMFNDNGHKASLKKIHNVYALEMAKATYNAFRKYSPNERHFLLTRAGYAGIQRYSAVWTGDNIANNEHLQLACTMVQGMGLSGLSFTGSDVGGFSGEPTNRLFTRWMQLGAFTPFFRGHSAKGEKAKEPWAFGENTENLVRDAISLRYKFLPFMYNEFHNSSVSGLPIVRAMVLNYQNDDECYSYDAQYQFMIGDNLLVAPVLNDNDNTKKLYLPVGNWYDWWTGKQFKGGKWILVEAPISTIPLFVKEGGMIPTQEVEQYVGEKEIKQLELNIFPSSKSTFDLYEDDGISFNFENGNYLITEFNCETNKNGGTIKVKQKHNKFDSGRKNYMFDIHNVKTVSAVAVDGSTLKKYDDLSSLKKSEHGYYLNNKNELFIKTADKGSMQVSFQY